MAETDIPVDDKGDLVRPYKYEQPGFYAEASLKKKLSSTQALDGDTRHEKVKVKKGDTLFMADDQGAVFKLSVGAKPSPNRIALEVERVQ